MRFRHMLQNHYADYEAYVGWPPIALSASVVCSRWMPTWCRKPTLGGSLRW